MHDRPDKQTLLDAVAGFLALVVRPKIEDKALNFRVLIAAHLCSVASSEIRTEDVQDLAQLMRLAAIFPDEPPPPDLRRESRERSLRALEAELARRIREGSLDERQRALAVAHVRETLREKLRVINPRFDLSDTLAGD
jgi:hypothetical protein